MFLRSARNAGFEVPADRIDDAVAFVKRSFDQREGIFIYSTRKPSRTRSMAGAGILALAHAGLHHTQEAQRAGDWLLRSPVSTNTIRQSPANLLIVTTTACLIAARPCTS